MRTVLRFNLAVLIGVVAFVGASDLEAECITVWEPVCGDNLVTYSNSCFAEEAGVAVLYTGECRTCGGIAGLECESGEFCDFPAGTCEVADNQGVCRPIPEICTKDYRPVCGCDGSTYGNDCERQMAEVALSHAGVCRSDAG